MTQIVNKPTRMRAALDQCYTNMNDLYHDLSHLAPVGLLDDQVVLYQPSAWNFPRSEPVFTTNRRQGPREKAVLQQAIASIHWEPMYKMKSHEQFTFFYQTMEHLIQKCLPLKTVKQCSHDRPWVTTHIKELIDLRQFYFHSGKNTMYR